MTYHQHIPDNSIVHTIIRSFQTRAQPKSIVRIAEHAHVGNATTQIPAKQGMVNVGTGPMPTIASVDIAHCVEGVGGTRGAVVVVVEVDVVDIQMGVDLLLD